MKEKLRKIILVLEKFLIISSASLDVWNKLKVARKKDETLCPKCEFVLWKGAQPSDWLTKVEDHLEGCKKSRVQEERSS